MAVRSTLYQTLLPRMNLLPSWLLNLRQYNKVIRIQFDVVPPSIYSHFCYPSSDLDLSISPLPPVVRHLYPNTTLIPDTIWYITFNFKTFLFVSFLYSEKRLLFAYAQQYTPLCFEVHMNCDLWVEQCVLLQLLFAPGSLERRIIE